MNKKYLRNTLLSTILATTYLSAGTPSGSDNGFHKKLSLNGLTFILDSKNEGSLNNLSIKTIGLKDGDKTIIKEIDGQIVEVKIDDLNKDGFAEIYISSYSAGSGSYGSLLAYNSNKNKSLSEIHMGKLEDDKKASKGYMGHDSFTFVKGAIIRKFPIYKKDDANCCPKGGSRYMRYNLVEGESGLVLKVINLQDY